MKIKGVTIKVDHLAKFQAGVRELTKNSCFVGYPEESTDRKPDKDDPVPVTNAGLGFIHEHGAPEAHIPARPHLRPGIEQGRGKFNPILQATARKALDGDVEAVKKGLTQVGRIAQGSVRLKIIEGPFVPLAESTLKARKRRGFKGELPLNVTGQLRRAVNFVIRGSS